MRSPTFTKSVSIYEGRFVVSKEANAIKNTADLRSMLIETIEEVRSGKLDAKQARTIAALSTTVLQSAKLDLDFLRFRASNAELDDSANNVLRLIAEPQAA